MPALAPYIPPKDAALNNWVANFSSLITADPATYGLVSGDAVAIAAVVATWTAAYALVTSPMTKTAATVSAKNMARIAMLATIRPYAQTISLNAGVTSGNKTALGINPRTSVPVPITAPTTYPVLTIVSGFPLNLIMRYRDQMASPSVKSKPYGVIGCMISAQTSPTVITDPTKIQVIGPQPKCPYTQSFPGGSSGLVAYMAARWVTKKGLFGPWSPIVSSVVP